MSYINTENEQHIREDMMKQQVASISRRVLCKDLTVQEAMGELEHANGLVSMWKAGQESPFGGVE